MKHYIVSISNRNEAGGIDAASTKHFLVSTKDTSLDFTSLLMAASEAILKNKTLGLSASATSKMVSTDVEGDIKNYGVPLRTDARFEVRQMK